MKKELDIIIQPDGTIKVEMLNGSGTTCLAEIEAMFSRIGPSKKIYRKPEFFEKDKSEKVKV